MRFYLLSLVLSLASCASQQLYYWNHHEPVIYDDLVERVGPNKCVEQMRKEESEARKGQLPLSPGYYAYLGYLYYQVGNINLAKEYFVKEKNMFPESEVLMNRFLKPPGKK